MRHATKIASLAAAGLCLAGLAGDRAAVFTDPLDTTAGFFQMTPAGNIAGDAGNIAGDAGKVVLTKADAMSDSFVRWGKPNYQSVPFSAGQGLEVDLAETTGGAKLQVMVAPVAPDGAEHDHYEWLKAEGEAGTKVLPDLSAFSAEHGHPDATSFRLPFRHVGNPAGAVAIDEVRVTAAP